jgi:hypothetical protein
MSNMSPSSRIGATAPRPSSTVVFMPKKLAKKSRDRQIVGIQLHEEQAFCVGEFHRSCAGVIPSA